MWSVFSMLHDFYLNRHLRLNFLVHASLSDHLCGYPIYWNQTKGRCGNYMYVILHHVNAFMVEDNIF